MDSDDPLSRTLGIGSTRTVGYAEFGPAGGTPVIWCHGGPGSRLSPAYVADTAAQRSIRIIGIDRPGYGLSTPQPGRSITDTVGDVLAVADHLGIDTFFTVGTSTGGAYALAAAALAPNRVKGVIACCAMTDMRHLPARNTMSRPHALAVWEAPDRERALAAALASHGSDGSKIIESAEGPPLPASDLAMFNHPWGRHWMATLPDMFAHGVEGYTDDRLADGGGWTGFDASTIACPVIVLHGGADVMVDPIHARHTTSFVPNAELRIVDGAGHFSIEDHIVAVIEDLRQRAT